MGDVSKPRGLCEQRTRTLRSGLIHAAAIAVLVMLAIGGGWLWLSRPAASPVTAADASEDRQWLAPGPWGRVSIRRVNIAPPMDAVEIPEAGPVQPRWYFPHHRRDELADFLASLELSDAHFEALLERALYRKAIEGYVLRPSPEMVASLAPEVRSRIYRRLATSRLNRDQVNAYRYCGPDVASWLRGSGIRDRTRRLIETLAYRHGNVHFFADLPLVLDRIESESERLKLVKALARESTFTLHLHVAPGEDVAPLIAWWGRGDHSSDVAAMLRSLADSCEGGSIDVVHLLPSFARARLYTYPRGADELASGESRDCHWTALNFDRPGVDDRFANADFVSQTLEREYEAINEAPRFGDVIAFIEDDHIYHSAVYIADDILFTKNGPRHSRPWMFIEMDAMKRFYPREGTIERQVLRRR